MRLAIPALVAAMLWSGSIAIAADHTPFDKAVQPFMETYCLRCHNDKKQKGKFRLDTLSRDFGTEDTAQRWAEVIFRMNSGEMPPEDELKQPSPEELSNIVDWLSDRITEGRATRMAKRGPVTHYRLSRDEYANTVYDLLGVHYDVKLPGAFNEDPRWHGFERIGSLLSLSPSHVTRYFKAAETVLDRAFPQRPVASRVQRRDSNDKREDWLKENNIEGRVRWLMWPEHKISAMSVRDPGVYRIRIQLSGMPALDGRLPHLSIWHQQLKQTVFDQDVSAPEDSPTTLEFEMVLSAGGYQLMNVVPRSFNPVGNHTYNVTRGGGSIFTTSRDMRFMNPTGYKLFTDDGHAIHPTLIVDWIEWEGPLTSDSDHKKREGLLPTAVTEQTWNREDTQKVDAAIDEARITLNRFAERAWRRPVTDDEIDPYIQIIKSEIAANEHFRNAYRAALVGMLTSKNFYYIEEGSVAAPRDHLNNWELASRLSYFLWGSMPDEELFTAARTGDLSKPEVLQQQLDRMLADPKIDRLIDAFPSQWLQLHRVGMFPPDPKLYPDYDNWLEKSMVLESSHFFREVLSKNLSVREFLVSDWSMINPRLAMHYGMPPLSKPGFQRVALKPEDHRGGVLTHASVLSLTSDGTRHRPVHRGVLVWETMFARTPPPPPPNVEPLEPTPSNKPKATIRDQLVAHSTHTTCASCHRKIDPLGFAFDNFDAIGRWRTEEVTATGSGANPPVDASGVLVDGRKFSGPDDFKLLLADDTDEFAKAFIEQLATFALRRVLTIDDAGEVQAIANASRADEYRLQTLVRNFVLSDLFLRR